MLRSWQVSEVQWLPNGNSLVIRGSDHPDAQERLTDRICVLSLPDAALREIAAPKVKYAGLSVSPDGASVAYRAPEVDGPIPHDVFIQPLRNGPAVNMTASRVHNRVDAFVWTSDSSFVALAEDGFSNRLYQIGADGPAHNVEAAADDTIAFDRKAGVLALVRQSWTERPELWISLDGGPPRQATNLNREWRDIGLIAPQYLHFRSFDSTQIEAALLVPASYRKGTRVPAVVMVHGGPPGRWSNPPHTWGYPTGQVLAAQGYAVLYPNVRGSSGYGQKFIEMNRGDLGGGDFKDLMAGMDYLVQAGIADPDRLGISRLVIRRLSERVGRYANEPLQSSGGRRGLE